MSALKKAFSRQPRFNRGQLSVVSYLLIAICSLLIANLFIFTSPAFAADPPCLGEWCPLSSNNYNDEIATQRFGQNVLSFGYGVMFGKSPMGNTVLTTKVASKIENGQEVLTYTPGLSKGDLNNGALAMTTQGIIALYNNPPTSSAEYLANLGENMGISPKSAYAQSVSGSGQNVIQPVLALWQVTSNIAYVAFILVFVAAGLMIMFRQKLNPQTIIGIQQALPGLIIGLILVTFSYFIAAFIVDLTFVGMRLVATIFQSTNTSNYYAEDRTNANPNGTFDQVYQNSDAFEMYGRPATRIQNGLDVVGGVWGLLNPTDLKGNFDFRDLATKTGIGAAAGCTAGFFAAGVGCLVGVVVGGVIGAITSLSNINPVGAAGSVVVTALASILVPLILAIALMIQFIRLIIALLMSYIQILIMVVFGPFLILFSAIPGRGGTLSYWLKALFANALVFPAVFAGFLFAGMLLNYTYTSNASMPLFGGIQTNIIGTLLAFGVLLGLPSIPDMVRESLGVKGPKGFTQAAIGGFMGGFNTGRGAVTGGYNQAMERTGIRTEQQTRQKQMIEGNAANWNAQGGRVAGGRGGLIGRVRERAISGWFS